MTSPPPPLTGTSAAAGAPAPPTAGTVEAPVEYLGAHQDPDGLRERLTEAVRAIDAPDVVIGYSRGGRRALCTGGTAPPAGPVPRDRLRYEAGSATKTFTGALAAEMVAAGEVSWDDRAASLLTSAVHPGDHPITLFHLATHTSGLPRLPANLYPQAVRSWHTNPYAGYPRELVIDAFLRHRGRPRPGTRWRYSNFGVAVLGHALAAATGRSYGELLRERVLEPLGCRETTTDPSGVGVEAVGHRRDGRTPVPPLETAGFAAAGAVRATPHDLLGFLEHLVAPEGTEGTSSGASLGAALRAVRRPVLRRGLGHAHTHTLCWFEHPSDQGPLYFHSGATSGQQAFLGFRPGTGTAVVALATRRFRFGDTFQATAYELLHELGRERAPGSSDGPVGTPG